MLRYIHGNDLHRYPRLAHSMFTDRAKQFKERLKWDVTVHPDGEERDQYDPLNPLYVIWEMPDGRHGGSMRFMPTLGRTMVNEHFAHLNNGAAIRDPLIWETTRFCLSPDADRRALPALSLGAGEVMETFRLRNFVGVFDARMERIYEWMGLEPQVLGRVGTGRDAIGVGLWSMDASAFGPTLSKLGITRGISRSWLRYSFTGTPVEAAEAPPQVRTGLAS